jgi:hypothetical protein
MPSQAGSKQVSFGTPSAFARRDHNLRSQRTRIVTDIHRRARDWPKRGYMLPECPVTKSRAPRYMGCNVRSLPITDQSHTGLPE